MWNNNSKEIYMKRLLLFLSIVLQLNVFCFAQSKYSDVPDVIYYAINDDYEAFEKYVKNGGDLNVTTEKGMNLPVSMAYFSEKNFKKACSLLKSKKVSIDTPNEFNFSLLHYLCFSGDTNKVKIALSYKPDLARKSEPLQLTPVQMTQYINYQFYENQPYYYEEAVSYFDIQKLIMKKDWYDFESTNITYGYYGNFVLALFNAVTSFNPYILPQQLFSFDLVKVWRDISRDMATVTPEKLQNFIDTFLPGSEITEYKDNIKEKLIECSEADDEYIIIAQTGNSPVTKFEWITIEGFKSETIDDDTLILYSTADTNFANVEYRVKDISFVILIKKN